MVFPSSFALVSLLPWLLIECRVSEAFAPPSQSFLLASTAPRGTTTTPTTTALADTATKDDDAYQVLIEYCVGCKWGLRGFWTAQELLSTFRDDKSLGAVTVIPSETAGRYAVSAASAKSSSTVLWDRQEEEGFPEMKRLKQLVRDLINPDRYLGHSDSAERQEEDEQATSDGAAAVIDVDDEAPVRVDTTLLPCDIFTQGVPSPHVTITYCTGCNWLLRAAYTAQELVSTFGDEIQAVTLLPSRPPAKGGAFIVTVDDATVWDRTEQGRFPETKELKQLVRDVLNPDLDLGKHVDQKNDAEGVMPSVESMDDDEAADARKYFGVM